MQGLLDGNFLEVLLPFIAVGFLAQLVDGALGMAFGVISTTLFVTLGVPPATASAGVPSVSSCWRVMPWIAAALSSQSVQPGRGRIRWLSASPSSNTHATSIG